MQQNQQINYFTYKEVQLGEELLTYLPGKKKKSRKSISLFALKNQLNVFLNYFDKTIK